MCKWFVSSASEAFQAWWEKLDASPLFFTWERQTSSVVKDLVRTG